MAEEEEGVEEGVGVCTHIVKTCKMVVAGINYMRAFLLKLILGPPDSLTCCFIF